MEFPLKRGDVTPPDADLLQRIRRAYKECIEMRNIEIKISEPLSSMVRLGANHHAGIDPESCDSRLETSASSERMEETTCVQVTERNLKNKPSEHRRSNSRLSTNQHVDVDPKSNNEPLKSSEANLREEDSMCAQITESNLEDKTSEQHCIVVLLDTSPLVSVDSESSNKHFESSERSASIEESTRVQVTKGNMENKTSEQRGSVIQLSIGQCIDVDTEPSDGHHETPKDSGRTDESMNVQVNKQGRNEENKASEKTGPVARFGTTLRANVEPESSDENLETGLPQSCEEYGAAIQNKGAREAIFEKAMQTISAVLEKCKDGHSGTDFEEKSISTGSNNPISPPTQCSTSPSRPDRRRPFSDVISPSDDVTDTSRIGVRGCAVRRRGPVFSNGVIIFPDDVVVPPRPDSSTDFVNSSDNVVASSGMKSSARNGTLRKPLPTSNTVGNASSEDDEEYLAGDDDDDYVPSDEESELEDEVKETLYETMEELINTDHDLLPGIENEFQWSRDYSTFSSEPEVFTGPIPGPTIAPETPHDAFVSIWNKEIMSRIVEETNRYAERTCVELSENKELSKRSRLQEWRPTDVSEMYVLFAVFIYMGIDIRTKVSEYWQTSTPLAMQNFGRVMSRDRYNLLTKFLHFVDNDDPSRPQNRREANYKLFKIRPILNHLNDRFQSLYNLKRNICIDESLTLYKGKLSWLQLIRTKKGRLGIKSFELCCSESGYLYKFRIYTGRKSADELHSIAPSLDLAMKSTETVLELLEGLKNRGHCVTMESYYNSPALARYLKANGFDCIGTLNPNRKHVPQEIKDISLYSKCVPQGTIVGYHSGDVSVISWKDTRVITMISTFHYTSTVVGSRRGKRILKPTVVVEFNKTMGAVNLKDQKLEMFPIERTRSAKGYIKMFKRLLNVSIYNSFILLNETRAMRNLPRLTHREFRYQLAEELLNCNKVRSTNLTRIQEPPSFLKPDSLLRLSKDVVHTPVYCKGSATGPRNRKVCIRCSAKFIYKKKKRLISQKEQPPKVQTGCETCGVALCFGECWNEYHSMSFFPEDKG